LRELHNRAARVTEEILQASVRQLHFCFVSDGPKHRDLVRQGGGVLEKGGLSYARLTEDNDGSTVSYSARIHQGCNDLAFMGPPSSTFSPPHRIAVIGQGIVTFGPYSLPPCNQRVGAGELNSCSMDPQLLGLNKAAAP
jgi:hypothetical protein